MLQVNLKHFVKMKIIDTVNRLIGLHTLLFTHQAEGLDEQHNRDSSGTKGSSIHSLFNIPTQLQQLIQTFITHTNSRAHYYIWLLYL